MIKRTADRFWCKVTQRGPDDCWEWKAGTYSDGYGSFKIGSTTLRAHRVAWALKKGQIPDNLIVCHHCDNRLCCNVNHMFLGTKKDNQYDMLNKGVNRGKFYEGEAWLMKRLYTFGFRCSFISRLFRSNKSSIYNIVTGSKYFHKLEGLCQN